ncbi:MAG TPA: ThuA domain-containing protein [Tepidisphaeraceae bacterium]
MHTVLLILGGQIAYHNYPQTAQILADVLEKDGLGVRTAQASPAEIDLAGADAVVVFTDGDFFTDDAITRLAAYVRRGHGLVTLHTAANTNVASPLIGPLVGSRVQGGVIGKHAARIVDADHAITRGISDFDIDDEIHDLKPLAAYRTLVDGDMNGSRQPLVYVKAEGEGRTVHLAHGHAISGISNPVWQEIFRRSVRWAINGDDAKA